MKKIYALLAIILFPLLLDAQTPCALDASFGSGGKLVSTGSRMAEQLLIQADGKILVGMEPFGSSNLRIRRLNSDGTTDITYGTNGTTTIQVGEKATRIKDMHLYNGNLYIAGTTSTDIGGTTTYVYFAALDINGQLISTFGSNGIKSYRYTPKLYTVDGMAIDETGNIYCAGKKTSSTFYAMKLSSTTGNVVTSFGTNGLLDLTPLGSPANLRFEIKDVKIDKVGKILIAGSRYLYANTGSTEYYGQIMRIHSNGTLDNTFGTNGLKKYYTDPLKSHLMQRVLVNKENDYFLTGMFYTGSHYDYAIVKAKNNGSTDNSFGANGWRLYDLSGNSITEAAYNAHLMPDEKILLNGNHGSGDTVYFSMLMLNSDGTRDVSFAPNGYFTNIFNQNNNSSSRGLAVDPSGKIVLGGYTRTCSGGICGPLYMAISCYTFDIGSPSNTNSVQLNKEIRLYPNPAAESMEVRFTGTDKMINAEVYTLMGSNANAEFNKKRSTLSLKNLATGTYFVRLKLENKTIVKQLVILSR